MAVLPGAGHPAPATNDVTSAPRVPGPAREPEAATVREAGPAALPEPCVLLKVGEIVLKGGNRHHFERLLQQNIRRAVRELGVGVRLWNRNGVMVLRLAGQHGTSHQGPGQQGPGGHGPTAGPSAEAAMDRVAARVSSVMGIARVCRAARVAKDPEAAIGAAVTLAAGRSGSFAVRARRRDKCFPLTSAQLNREIGARVQRAYGYPVNPWSPATRSARSAARRSPTSPRWTTPCPCRCCAR